MEFRTSLPVLKQETKIELGYKFVTMGSCFANSIDQKLKDYKFESLNNPLGIIYDPSSIANQLMYAITGNRPVRDSYLPINNRFVNLVTHSDVSCTSFEETEELIDTQLLKLGQELKQANQLVITLGTSWVYTHKQTGLQVANCHKIPQKQFNKSLLTFEQTKPVFKELLNRLSVFNPNLQIILTVSPVRHVKDTLPLNNLSKAHLFMLCHYLANNYSHVHYYPAYELLVDDLRDYRFYKPDMIHPTHQAIEYIWNHFVQSYFTDDAIAFIKEWSSIRKALLHKPFNPESEQHQLFLSTTIKRLQNISSAIEVQPEIEELKKQLLNGNN